MEHFSFLSRDTWYNIFHMTWQPLITCFSLPTPVAHVLHIAIMLSDTGNKFKLWSAWLSSGGAM